jgi:hypothetical protein
MPTFLKSVGKALLIVVFIIVVAITAYKQGARYVHYVKTHPNYAEKSAAKTASNAGLHEKENSDALASRAQQETTSLGLRGGTVAKPQTDKSIVSHPEAVFELALEKQPINWGWVITASLLVLAGAWRVLTVRDLSNVSDSPAFTEALNYFSPCIAAACDTPRSVKQLINRIRLYAMLHRHWSLDPKKTAGPNKRLREGQGADLAIYGILEKLCPNQLEAALAHPSEAAFKLELIDPNLGEFNERAVKAIRSLTAPGSKEDFERLVRSIEKDEDQPPEVPRKAPSTVDGDGEN